ncbi:UDP-2,4-diacetamido-2,4,6-trideoxy-beta-L-altropyranose hydrolase [Rhodobacterales bacterium 59_46_T64]|nr:UDP-2,4-diacetamido-2,4,6-trideoxy-beta-L-altropyranose hydrolase [Rhodobacterales bacterium 59_46_T64]
MRLLIRADGDARIGGGHVMRCLSLADAAQAAGHHVHFVMITAEGGMADWVRAAGYGVTLMPAASGCDNVQGANRAGPADAVIPMGDGPEGYTDWLRQPMARDAARTAEVAQTMRADWVILDHYGVDRRWVATLREALRPGGADVKLMVFDDLDDRDWAADMVLDQTRLGRAPRRQSALARLSGPQFALLRPEFAKARPAALARRGSTPRRVMIAPGMMDAAGLAPLAVAAITAYNAQKPRAEALVAEVVMGSASQSRAEVEAYAAKEPAITVTLDATDMAARMTAADLCIGAGGTTSWERCCLGLPTLSVSVSANQEPGVAALAQAGASVTLSLAQARDQGRLIEALQEVIASAPMLARRAAEICDGTGAARVVSALDRVLRPLREEDAARLFEWRNQPHIRAASLTSDPLVWEDHQAWVRRAVQRDDGVFCIYGEGGRDLGAVSAICTGAGVWRWSFYIGAPESPKGAGRRMLAAFLREMALREDVNEIEAEVLPENAASIHLHRALGFATAPLPENSPALAFRLSTWDVRERLALPHDAPPPPIGPQP